MGKLISKEVLREMIHNDPDLKEKVKVGEKSIMFIFDKGYISFYGANAINYIEKVDKSD